MGVIQLSFSLPDGQETALIAEFATFHGWTGTGTASAYAKSVLAEVIRTSIRNSREDAAQKTAQQSVVTPVIS